MGALVNLLLLRGNIGKPGAGCQSIRGHSNVQGQRTVGITEKPKLAPMQKYRELFGFEPPTENGVNTVEFVEALLEGKMKGFVGARRQSRPRRARLRARQAAPGRRWS